MNVLAAVRSQPSTTQTASKAAADNADAALHDAAEQAKLAVMQATTESLRGDVPTMLEQTGTVLSSIAELRRQVQAEAAKEVGTSTDLGTASADHQQQGAGSAELLETTLRHLVNVSLQQQESQASGGGHQTTAAAAGGASASGRSSSPATSATSSSGLSISQELDHLLAVTEAEVKREMARTAAAKQQQLALQMAAARVANTARLQPVPEEPSNSGSTVRAAAATGRRLPGSVTHSAAASPAHSTASSPTKRQGAANRAVQKATASRHTSSSSSYKSAGSSSPPAVNLAMSGLEPLTQYGRAVRGLSAAFQVKHEDGI